MSDNEQHTEIVATTPAGVDVAAGVAAAKWYVAIVNNRSEKLNSERLNKLGIENYVPVQSVMRVWKNGKKAKVEKVVIPAVIFIHCTEKERREAIVRLPFIFRFMTNKAGCTSGVATKPPATVSDKEIERLKFMLGQSDIPVEITEGTFQKGDKVRVVRGSLKGLEGEVIGLKAAQSEMIVSLEHFGCARLTIDSINLELIK